MKSRNLWPLLVASIIIFGFIIVIALVYASLIQPGSPGHEYLENKKEVERHLDIYMKGTQYFYDKYKITLSTQNSDSSNKRKRNFQLDFIPPFERKSVINNPNQFSIKQGKNNLALILTPRDNDQRLVIENAGIFAIHYYDKEYKSRADYLASFGTQNASPIYKKVQILESSTFKHDGSVKFRKSTSLPFIFDARKIGRWKIIARIMYKDKGARKSAYLEGDLIVL